MHIFSFIMFFSLHASAQFLPEYYGAHSQEVILSFSHFVETEAPSSENMSRILIDQQLTYLFGGMENNETQGVPRTNHSIENIRVEKNNGRYRIHYTYTGHAVLNTHFGNEYQFPLPRHPASVYQRSLVVNSDGSYTHTCLSNSNYTQEYYFWYFWSVNRSACSLVLGVDYDIVKARIKKIANTKKSYPEYERLFNSNHLKMDILIGMNDEYESRQPYSSKDIAARNYEHIAGKLTEMGYQTSGKWSLQQVQKIAPKTRQDEVFVESFSKTKGQRSIEVRLFFGPSSLSMGQAFHHFLKDSLEQSNVLIYAGHSGLGDYLDLRKIEFTQRFKIQFNPEYQLYFFNSCTSYPYYNSSYFERKNGSKNLDILTNGISTLFVAIDPSTDAVINAIDLYLTTNRRTSYQEIIRNADSNNMVGVNGDEDNPN